MTHYYRSQLTSSNGHVVGIDSPMRESPPVANPDRYERRIQNLMDGGFEGIAEYEKYLCRMKIESCIDIDARAIGLSLCREARERLEQGNAD